MATEPTIVKNKTGRKPQSILFLEAELEGLLKEAESIQLKITHLKELIYKAEQK